jgi:hypothetical protein
LPSAVKQVYLPAWASLEDALDRLVREQRWPARSAQEAVGYLVYEPNLVGLAKLRFPHTRSRQTARREVAYLLPAEAGLGGLDWSAGQVELDTSDLDRRAEPDAYYAELPDELGGVRSLSSFQKDFADYLYYNSSIPLLYNPKLKLYSKLDETDERFQRRCREAAEDARDAEVEKLEAKYERKLDTLEDRLEREERELEEDKIEHSARKQEELLSGAESIFGLFSGRKSSRRLSTASRKRRMTRQAQADIKESEEAIEYLEEQIEELEEEARREVAEITERWQTYLEEVEEEEVKPRRTDVQISLFALAWLPRWEVEVAGQILTVPAFETEPV